MMDGNRGLIRIILTMGMFLFLSGCSTYVSTFGGGDAPGAKYMPMDKVDRLIASGEIEEYTKEKRCKGSRRKRSKVTKESDLPVVSQDAGSAEIEFNGDRNF